MDEEYVDPWQKRFINCKASAMVRQGEEVLRISKLSPEDAEKELAATVDRLKKTYPNGFKKAFPHGLHLGPDGLYPGTEEEAIA